MTRTRQGRDTALGGGRGAGGSAQHRLAAVIMHGGDGSPTKQTDSGTIHLRTTAAKPEGASLCALAQRLLFYPAEHFRCCRLGGGGRQG